MLRLPVKGSLSLLLVTGLRIIFFPRDETSWGMFLSFFLICEWRKNPQNILLNYAVSGLKLNWY